ncbi:hypothetical protein PFICI_08182 [Pestalotiopsis fici W106-1]|uniref:PH domain-containing protein n=1 Tax=Pestalotiopsis fici (strain W106-1 / CGMCC3.15140) TaxID=1229662 RepID=W3X3E2_PESFW|nr:uncharacterized protein PFICI_08182 [Pestalotiopsis fici W106-1]ETS80653.1 hypothetical protein PFICI_08182 [Pestalotiopsis fici W106-1]
MSRPEEPSGGSATQAPKFSRYRSLRAKSVSTGSSTASSTTTTTTSTPTTHAHANTAQHVSRVQSRESEPPVGVAAPAPANSIARSMSRYRRRGASVSVPDDNATSKIAAPQECAQPLLPPVPAIPSTVKPSHDGRDNLLFSQSQDDGLSIHQDDFPLPPSSRRDRQLRHSERATTDLARQAKELQDQPNHDSQRMKMAQRDDSERRWPDDRDLSRHVEQALRNEGGAERPSTRQRKKTLENIETSMANRHQTPLKSKSPVVEKFVALTKRRKSKEGLSPTSSTAGSIAGSVDFGNSQIDLPEVPKLPVGIEAGGKGIVPQKDAPVSASNHGDRIVSVRCGHQTFVLPITPETTPVDVVLETAKNMTYDLEWSPQQCVVRESYGPLGLERRIRKYEHIRDVMNSWDRDTHNHLIVTISTDVRQDLDLDIESVPDGEEPPRGMQLYLYHSNRPGKWSKRWITLTENGQVLCAKKPDASPSEKDTLSLCHMSDYDIYTPTESQMRRRLKPPKKHCLAIKSQHKPAMFMDTENYVQYFSTDDPGVAALFYEKVQGWRSWYLVDRQPAPRRFSIPKTDEKPPQLPFVKHAPQKSANIASAGGHRLKVSVDESPYALGEFQPLLDMKRFDKRLSLFGQDFLPAQADHPEMPKQASAYARKASKDGKADGLLVDKIKSSDDDAFTGNGLLGQDYEARKAGLEKAGANTRTMRKDSGTKEDHFMPGSLLPNQRRETDNSRKVDASWFPSALEHSAKYREPEAPRPNTSAGVVSTRSPHGRSRSGSRPPPVPQQSQSRTRPDRDRPPMTALPRPLGSHDPRSADNLHALANGRQQPKPLVDLTPAIREPPQWAKKGHGVQPTEGMRHLVDMISVGGPNDKPHGLLEVPPRSALRKSPTNTAPLLGATLQSSSPVPRSGGGLSRTRSKSSGAPPSRPLIRDVPPVPTMPPTLPGAVGGGSGGRSMTMTDKDRIKMDAMRDAMMAREREFKDRERGRARGRDREREAREEFYSSGRTGTMKVV